MVSSSLSSKSSSGASTGTRTWIILSLGSKPVGRGRDSAYTAGSKRAMVSADVVWLLPSDVAWLVIWFQNCLMAGSGEWRVRTISVGDVGVSNIIASGDCGKEYCGSFSSSSSS